MRRPSFKAYVAFSHQEDVRWQKWVAGWLGIHILGLIALTIIAMIISAVLVFNEGASSLKDFSDGALEILSFAFAAPLFFIICYMYNQFHQRPILKLFTSAKHFRWDFLYRAILITCIAYFVDSALKTLLTEAPLNNGKPSILTLSNVLFAFILSLIIVPFQAAGEELLYRGYWVQAMSTLVRSPWIIFLVPSTLFALAHLGNVEMDQHLTPYLFQMFTFAMLMCTLVYFEGGLESAIGVHILHNISVMGLSPLNSPVESDMSSSRSYELTTITELGMTSFQTHWVWAICQTLVMATMVFAIITFNRRAETRRNLR